MIDLIIITITMEMKKMKWEDLDRFHHLVHHHDQVFHHMQIKKTMYLEMEIEIAQNLINLMIVTIMEIIVSTMILIIIITITITIIIVTKQIIMATLCFMDKTRYCQHNYVLIHQITILMIGLIL